MELKLGLATLVLPKFLKTNLDSPLYLGLVLCVLVIWADIANYWASRKYAIYTQKQLLSLIRDFTSERSRGAKSCWFEEGIESLESEVEAANSELENAKRIKEVAEEELNGYEVELSLNDARIYSLEARISVLQDEVSTIGNEMDALKNEEGLLRDQFISQMVELNKEIREFHKTVDSSFANDCSTGIAANVKVLEVGSGANPEIENMLCDLNSQLAKEEEGYRAKAEDTRTELAEYEKKMSLIEAIRDKTNSVQTLARQASEFEQTLVSLRKELQKRCRCQHCHAENLEVLSLLLQGDQAY